MPLRTVSASRPARPGGVVTRAAGRVEQDPRQDLAIAAAVLAERARFER